MNNTEYTYQLTPEVKKEIDAMSRLEMCRIWRFGGGHYTMGEIGKYFEERLFKHHGGFTAEISKQLGW